MLKHVSKHPAVAAERERFRASSRLVWVIGRLLSGDVNGAESNHYSPPFAESRITWIESAQPKNPIIAFRKKILDGRVFFGFRIFLRNATIDFFEEDR
jgi:hypothetical protein